MFSWLHGATRCSAIIADHAQENIRAVEVQFQERWPESDIAITSRARRRAGTGAGRYAAFRKSLNGLDDRARRSEAMLRAFAILILLLTELPAQAELPNLVPPGWEQVVAEPGANGRRFVSRDGTAWMIARQTLATRGAMERDMDGLAYRDDEEITYQRRAATWIAVSGYRGDDIFYRKSNLACGGTRWNTIELTYPRRDKRRMDAAVTAIAHRMVSYYDQCPEAER